MGVGWGTAGEGWDGSAAAGGRNFAVFREEAMDFHSKKLQMTAPDRKKFPPAAGCSRCGHLCNQISQLTLPYPTAKNDRTPPASVSLPFRYKKMMHVPSASKNIYTVLPTFKWICPSYPTRWLRPPLRLCSRMVLQVFARRVSGAPL